MVMVCTDVNVYTWAKLGGQGSGGDNWANKHVAMVAESSFYLPTFSHNTTPTTASAFTT